MKTLIAALILITSTFASASNHRVEINELLPNIKIDGVHAVKHVGILNLNFAQKTMNLEIQIDLCGMYNKTFINRPTCRAMPITVAQLTVPLTAVDRDRCGSIIYSGSTESMSAEVAPTEIRVTDLSTSTCEVPPNTTLLVEASQSGTESAPQLISYEASK